MPNPNNYDSKDDFLKACIPMAINEGKEQDQAVAMCHSMWEDKNKKSIEKKLTFKTIKMCEPPTEVGKNRLKLKDSAIDSGLTSTETKDEHTIWAIVSTDDTDQDGDVILQDGINLTEYNKNPLFYYNHQHSAEFNIGKCMAIYAGEHSLIAKFAFDTQPDSLGDKLYKLYKEGRMTQFSVGFEENEISDKPSYCSKYGDMCKRVITKCTLYEISAVDMGANSETKVLEVKSKEDFMPEGKKIDRTHDIPYLAGTSKDDNTLYIDKDLPVEMEVNGIKFDPAKYLSVHEFTEKPQMDLGDKYEVAHPKATEAEKVAVEKDGINWAGYDTEMQKYIKADATKETHDIPDDLETCPYDQEGDEDMVEEAEKKADPELIEKQKVEFIPTTIIKTKPVYEFTVIKKVYTKKQLMSKGKVKI